MTRAGLVPVTLELLDHETILAVDDAHQLGLDRDAAAMLLVESDAPGAAAAGELDAAEAAILAAGATSIVRAADAQEADWLRQARRLALRALERQGTVRMEDVGVPRVAGPGPARGRSSGSRPRTGSGARRSATPATATSTRTSSSTATTRTPRELTARRSATRSSVRRSSSAGRSRPSTASAPRDASGCRSSAARARSR